jgi:hypothetical protein
VFYLRSGFGGLNVTVIIVLTVSQLAMPGASTRNMSESTSFITN